MAKSRRGGVNTVPDKKEVLQSLGEAWNQMNDETRAYLIGYGEGYIAARQAQAGA